MGPIQTAIITFNQITLKRISTNSQQDEYQNSLSDYATTDYNYAAMLNLEDRPDLIG
jgi:hypothetical protein